MEKIGPKPGAEKVSELVLKSVSAIFNARIGKGADAETAGLSYPTIWRLNAHGGRCLQAAEQVNPIVLKSLVNVSQRISQNPSTIMPKASKMSPKSIQDETKLIPDFSPGPPGGLPVENSSRRPLQDTRRTS